MKLNLINRILLIAVLISLISCKAEDKSMKVLVHINGTISEVQLNSAESYKVFGILSDLLIKTDDMLRVYLDEDRISELKSEENCIEILLDSVQKFDTGFLGETNISKVLFPLSGDYQASEKINIVTILIGEDEYSSGPLTASGGFDLLNELIGIVFNKK